MIWTGIEAGEPAGELGSVALLVKTSAVWAWAELRAAARAKRKRKIRRMVVGEMNLVKSLTERRGKFAEVFRICSQMLRQKDVFNNNKMLERFF